MFGKIDLRKLVVVPLLNFGVLGAVLHGKVPTVSVKNGTYSGVYLPTFNQDIFLGIPYSYPPTAPYRFLPAQPLNTTWEGTRNASNYGHTCPSASESDLALPYGMSEDCLFLNVVRPAFNFTAKKLPILFWIHGGSYQFGASSLPNYNLTYIVERSVELSTPIIAVSVNYRKGPWGLIYGEEIKKEGNENLAIKDVQLALRWTKENLGAFGGDVDKITIQGESSGSFMVGQLIVAGAGKTEKLFHQSIQESGSASTGTYNTTEWYEPKFQAILNYTSCDSLACLREIPYERLYPALNNSISGSWYPVLDNNLFPEHPAKLLATGQYHKIPMIDGVNTDEGTDNAQLGLNTELELTQHLTTVGNPAMTPESVATLLEIYDIVNFSDPSPYGIPFDTAIDPVALGLDLGTQYKRQAAIVGDLYYHATLLHDAELYSEHSTSDTPVFIYRFDTLPWNFTSGSTKALSQIATTSNTTTLVDNYKGVAHFSEVAFVFANPNFYGPNPEYAALAKQLSAFWINFVNEGNPTPTSQNSSVTWEPYFIPSNSTRKTDEDIVGNVLVMRTQNQGGCVSAKNDWRLAGREYFVKKYHEVYGE
ncbi:carboxylesterase family protein [Phlyctema vagabunda]|uniref:Carboxylic ester hydrolase n=1 Tax=Phlyctema vagabunda TaxID=108571 RepID=A0ABR4P5H9_9HELO